MIRTIIWFIYFWLYLIVSIPKYFIMKSRETSSYPVHKFDADMNKIVKHWSRSLVKLAGGKVDVYGEEKIPTDEAVVFVSNHQGNFDIPVILGFIEKPKGFIAKIEIKKMPLLGDWMRFLKCIFMDRSNPRAALKGINEGAEFVKNGYSLVIFPEGTRSPDGHVKEFKQGSLKLALKAKATVIPVAISGTYDMMKKGQKRIKPAHVTVRIGEPIDTAELSGHESKMLTDNVKTQIEALLAI